MRLNELLSDLQSDERIEVSPPRRALAGFFIGLGIAAIPILIGVIIGALIKGVGWIHATLPPDEELLWIFAGYSLSGILGGLLYPLGSTRVGAVVGGILLVIPAFWSLAAVEQGMLLLTDDSLVAVAGISLIVGPFVGFLMLRWLY